MENNRFSLENVFHLRARAFAKIRHLTADIDCLTFALESIDFALQTAIEERNIDDQQKLVTVARQLAAILDGGAA